MNLKEFRKLFIETSGRYDLWNDDGSDNGIDHYIRLGQKHLETLMYWDKMEAVQNLTLVGVSNFMLPSARIIERVAVRKLATEKFVDLVRVNLTQARKYVMDDIQNDGQPLFYTLYRNRGQMNTITAANFFDATTTYQDVLANQNYDSLGVLLTPLVGSTETMEVEVTGMFRSPVLVNDADKNYWTVEWPNLLVFATYRELEIVYRNTQGVKDWDAAIQAALIQHEMDYVMDESGQIDQMLG